MKKKIICTPGVYGFVDRRGAVVRVGQSECVERRVRATRREHLKCIGDAQPVLLQVVRDRARRLRAEKFWIAAFGFGSSTGRPPCNPRLAGLVRR